ncbi:hypothetical protein DEO72_LG11g2949 [Vigna unguiculata]|uniref:Uncharacterized protein n=1 Tax=Vigna unguiculata TaxID=3917 RepID=A0A4D6NQM8_VIGUN|nr:hypothetical protein DEO72_LG11g2949 [Vigna unguiculata]
MYFLSARHGESADCCHSFVRRIGSPNLKCSCSANQLVLWSVDMSGISEGCEGSEGFKVGDCSDISQLWAFDHFLFVKRKRAVIESKFPRLLRWIDYKVGDVSIRSSLKNNVEEISELVVKEALSKGDGERDKSKRKESVSGGTKKKEQLMGVIEQQEHDIRELGGAIAKLKSTLAERENKSKDEFVSPMNLNEVDVPSEAAEDRNATNSDMYVRMKNDPRLRLKSRLIQTPFAVYSRKKKTISK